MSNVIGFPLIKPELLQTKSSLPDGAVLKKHFLRMADLLSTNSEDTINLANAKIDSLSEKFPGNESVSELKIIINNFISNKDKKLASQLVPEAMTNIRHLVNTL